MFRLIFGDHIFIIILVKPNPKSEFRLTLPWVQYTTITKKILVQDEGKQAPCRQILSLQAPALSHSQVSYKPLPYHRLVLGDFYHFLLVLTNQNNAIKWSVWLLRRVLLQRYLKHVTARVTARVTPLVVTSQVEYCGRFIKQDADLIT